MLVDNEYQKYHPFGVGVGITSMILGFYHPAGVGCGVRIIVLGLYHPVGVGVWNYNHYSRIISPQWGWVDAPFLGFFSH